MLCDGAKELLESYGILQIANSTETNASIIYVDPVFKHWCYYESVPAVAHFLVGTLLIIICTLSITGNLLVIVVFTRYQRLRSPANTLIVNLAVSDMLNGLLHPMAAYSSFKEHWMFGRIGCEIYAALCGLFGLVSIVTLTAISIERCLVISVKPWYGGILLTQAKAKISIIIVWTYCLLIMLPPLFGWGAFVPEGFLTSCSFDYITRTPSNRSYFFYIFILGFFLPVIIITVCYSFIIRTIFQNEKDMKKNNVKKVHSRPKKRNDYKAAEMIMFVIGMFLVSWIPYSVIALIGQFGNRSILTPWICVLPSLFAKMSTIYNPAIYGLSHRHFRATLRRICKRNTRHSAERGGTYMSRNSSLSRTRYGCPCLPHYCASEVLEDSTSSFTGKKVYLGIVTNAVEASKIIYIKRPHPIYGSCRCDSSYRTSRKENSDVRLTTNSCSRQNSVASRGRPCVLAMESDAAKMSLIRSMMFKSESSIHQKYQIYLEKDHIVRIPTFICSYANFPRRAVESPNMSTRGLNSDVPKEVVRMQNVDTFPAEDSNSKNVIKTPETPSLNKCSEKTQILSKKYVYSDKLSQ